MLLRLSRLQFIGSGGGYRGGSPNTRLAGTKFVDNIIYRYHWLTALTVTGNLMINCGGPDNPTLPQLFGGFQWQGSGSMTGNAIAGSPQGYFFGGDNALSPGQQGFQLRAFSNNTAHNIERGLYCDNTCGSPYDPITGVTIWQSTTAFYMYARGRSVNGSDPQRGMPTLANIATADCSWCVFFAGISGNSKVHEIRYTGFAISSSLLLGQSDSNPLGGGKMAFNLAYFMTEARSLGMSPATCQNLGGPFYEQAFGADRFKGSPIGLGGETRITDVTLFRFTSTMRMNTNGLPAGTEGMQPHYFKGITIDAQSRTNLIYFPYTQQANMAKPDGNCLHRDCDGKRKAFIHDLDGWV